MTAPGKAPNSAAVRTEPISSVTEPTDGPTLLKSKTVRLRDLALFSFAVRRRSHIGPETRGVSSPQSQNRNVRVRGLLHQKDRYDRFSKDVKRLTGRSPMTVREFAQKNVAAFVPSTA